MRQPARLLAKLDSRFVHVVRDGQEGVLLIDAVNAAPEA
jgi:hypothetical protein